MLYSWRKLKSIVKNELDEPSPKIWFKMNTSMNDDDWATDEIDPNNVEIVHQHPHTNEGFDR